MRANWILYVVASLWMISWASGCPAPLIGQEKPNQESLGDGGQETGLAEIPSTEPGPADNLQEAAPETTSDEKASTQEAQVEPTTESTTPEPGVEPNHENGDETPTTDAGPDTGPGETPEKTPGETAGEIVAEADQAPQTWQPPQCNQVQGIVSVALSKDAGATLINPIRTWPAGIQYTYGLVALKAPNTLLALYGTTIYRSTDTGCNWTSIGQVGYTPMRLTLGANDRVWAWSDNADALYRIDGTTITKLTSPTPNIHGLGTDPNDADYIRIGGNGGALHETQNGGTLWRKQGIAAVTAANNITYRVAFNPNNLDHVIAGHTQEGFHVSTNGAQSWTKATGLTPTPGGKANGFNAVISPVDAQIVWAMGIDLQDTSGQGGGKHIYHSTDGGKSFTAIVTNLQANDVYLVNGPHLVAHPTDSNKMHWAFGTCTNQYGTNLYTYDASTQMLTWKNHPYPSFDEIVILPTLPLVYLLGIQTNSSPFCPK